MKQFSDILPKWLHCESYRTNNINICAIEMKWGGKKLKYDTITRGGEYQQKCEIEVIHCA